MRSRGTVVTIVVAAVAIVAVAIVGLALQSWQRQMALAARPRPRTAVVIGAPTPVATPIASPSPTPLPASVLIQVPYTSQSPYDQWGANDPHQNYCEAAALLMVALYYQGDHQSRIPPATADADMGHIVSVERSLFPGVLDLSVQDIAEVGSRLYGLQATVVPISEVTTEQELAEGHPVIIPVMTHGLPGGQMIAPYYGTVNVYHVIVVTGYDAARGVFYTNDAGFMQGQNYAYTWSTLAEANAAQAQRFPQGQVMLVFSPAS